VSNMSPVKKMFRCYGCCHRIRNSISNQFTPRRKIVMCQISVKELIKILFHSSAFILH